MILEIDQFAVNTADYERATNGDNIAKERIKKALDGEILYLHAFPLADGETVVSLRELEALGVLDSVTLHAYSAMSGT